MPDREVPQCTRVAGLHALVAIGLELWRWCWQRDHALQFNGKLGEAALC